MINECPVCESPMQPNAVNPTGCDSTKYDCQRCGSYKLTRTFLISLRNLKEEDPDAAAKLSHAIRRAQHKNECIQIDDFIATKIITDPLPRPKEQADLLIRWIAENVPGPGMVVPVSFEKQGSIIGSKTAEGFRLVLNHLIESGLITGKQIGNTRENNTTPSFTGWEYYETLRKGSATYGKAFMAMKFGDAKLDNVLEKVFKPSAEQAGFDLFKLNEVPMAGLIDDRLRVEIQSSDFLVADLTHDNLGAYWEAGYAEGLGKPVIYTCEKSKFASDKTHFDTNHHLTILWDANSPEAAGDSLKATIRATLPHLARLTDDDV